jgi:hypothetical protein
MRAVEAVEAVVKLAARLLAVTARTLLVSLLTLAQNLLTDRLARRYQVAPVAVALVAVPVEGVASAAMASIWMARTVQVVAAGPVAL